MIQKQVSGTPEEEQENRKNLKWTEQEYKATMNLHYFSA